MKHVSLLRAASVMAAALLPLAGCTVGPNYKRPDVPTPPAFKEQPPASADNAAQSSAAHDTSAQNQDGWKPGQPADNALKGDWWTIYNDSELSTLEGQIDTANQTLKAAEANFRAARAQIGYARSYEAPTIGVSPSVGAVRDSAHQPYFSSTEVNDGEGNFSLPFDLNYEVDLWGRIRRGVTAAREQAQANAADLESVRLSLHAELAMDYFGLRTDDAQTKLLEDTVKAYEQALQLTQDRFEGGAAPMSDVAQARTQLDQTKVQLTDIEVQRAQYEHAIAVLIGKPPAEFTLDRTPLNQQTPLLPVIPATVPAELLERRPDIAADERRMAAANEQIGIAQAAFYPTLSLSALFGLQGTSALNWFNWPSRFWAVGPTFSQTLFDAGRRKSTKVMTEAQYDATVATYRQTVLTAFQQVEDNLAALRVLSHEADQQHQATESAEQSLDLFQTRYEGGVDTYLQVVTWQTAALNNQRNDLAIMQRRLEASVLLIKALGGGWDTSRLPKM
ncbi:efflux transporter outer membrane subunit [Silvibacterium dinghuense]|uniref:Efflux transporter outer membrane subunit n=1 Tax=Silvibacterium dinghuense TaxID=1560006 RepID=A0A4Q1S9Z4_9BACT|nr:efflux transporter outer membrane subunit [Silvibacterium dinghuense]RXS93761.1 efflux transporter outer membrane subunit [Silvibacterium dinghuense]GGH07399.1 RND transporter [Silvibacterium dinghuense]